MSPITEISLGHRLSGRPIYEFNFSLRKRIICLEKNTLFLHSDFVGRQRLNNMFLSFSRIPYDFQKVIQAVGPETFLGLGLEGGR